MVRASYSDACSDDPDLGSECDSDAELSMLSMTSSSSSASSFSSTSSTSSTFSINDIDGGGEFVDAADAAADMLDLERQLEASIFQVEPVTHIAYQLLFVDDARALERVERHVMRLRAPNVIDRFDIGRIIKAARYDRQTVLYRLESLFVYNIDITFEELGSLLLSPEFPVARFITVLSSISNFTLRPTMACFHSANSIHIVLSRVRDVDATATATEPKRRVVITPAASTRRRRTHSS